jgi:hypothetical protein
VYRKGKGIERKVKSAESKAEEQEIEDMHCIYLSD